MLTAAAEPRARDLGVPFEGTPGPLNAITDVAGVEVGHTTLIRGQGKLVVGKGPVRTGVTAIVPRGRNSTTPVFAAWFTLNAAGEMTGTTWIEERGLLDGPILITNTHSVGVVRDAAVKWMVAKGWKADWNVPVAAETWDGILNDLNGFHVTQEHALAALDSARAGPVAEGAVGGGTGMICSRFKGGIGTSSRKLPADQGGYTVGVLVQCNYGARGNPPHRGRAGGRGAQGRSPALLHPAQRQAAPLSIRRLRRAKSRTGGRRFEGQGRRLDHHRRCHRRPLAAAPAQAPRQAALARARPLGSIASDGSGDIFLAFSTANPGLKSVDYYVRRLRRWRCSPTTCFHPCSRPRPRRPRKRSSTRWWRQRPWRAPTASASTAFPTTGSAKSLSNITVGATPMIVTRRTLLGSGAAVAAWPALAQSGDPRMADLVVRNARVHTVEPQAPSAQAFAVRDGRFIAVGSNDLVDGLVGPRTEVIDAGGATIVPGLIDCHIHADGETLLYEVLVGNPFDVEFVTIDSIVGKLRERAAKTPPGQWVEGYFYDDTKVKDGRLITRADLDRVSTEHPVAVYHRGGHTSFYNSKAFELAGVTREHDAAASAAASTAIRRASSAAASPTPARTCWRRAAPGRSLARRKNSPAPRPASPTSRSSSPATG